MALFINICLCYADSQLNYIFASGISAVGLSVRLAPFTQLWYISFRVSIPLLLVFQSIVIPFPWFAVIVLICLMQESKPLLFLVEGVLPTPAASTTPSPVGNSTVNITSVVPIILMGRLVTEGGWLQPLTMNGVVVTSVSTQVHCVLYIGVI